VKGRAGDQYRVNGVAIDGLGDGYRPRAVAGSQRFRPLGIGVGHHGQNGSLMASEAGGVNLADKTAAQQGKTNAGHFFSRKRDSALPK
jgi:hypothetical protein